MITNNIENIAGISKPLEKLIDVLHKFGETFYLPFKIRKMADAKGYEIERLADAEVYRVESLNKVNRTQLETLQDIEETGEYLIDKKSKSLKSNETSFSNRVKNRFINEQFKKQKNIDDIVYESALILNKTEKVSEEEVDLDWLNDFFRYAQDISNESMKKIWAKILSGEIEKPNTYSKRVLNIISNLSQKEAEKIIKTSQFFIGESRFKFILELDTQFSHKIEFLHEDLLFLFELGIVSTNKSGFELETSYDQENGDIYYIGNQVLYKIPTENNKIVIKAYPLTSVGIQLTSLFESPKTNNLYLQKFVTELDKIKGELFICSLSEYDENPTVETLTRQKYHSETK